METGAKRQIIIGTRGSALAMWQAQQVASSLRAAHPDRIFILQTIRTSGDVDRESALSEIGTRGIFVKEIESALLSGEIHIGVHSLKDLPSELHPSLVVAAVGTREDPRDVLVSRGKETLSLLPGNARVGTSSPRRASQVKMMRGDLRTDNIRGNVDTRVRKAMEGEYDAVVLAAAGMIRLGLQAHITEYFPPSLMLPAPGQGIVAVQTRAADQDTREAVSAIDDEATHLVARAERAFVRALGGGCTTPLAAYAQVSGARIAMEGLLSTPDGEEAVRERLEGEATSPERVGEQLAARILSAGGGEIMKKLGGNGGLTADG